MEKFMKASIKIALLFIVGTLFFSCASGRPIVRTAPDNNQTYRVDYLFEHDGCKVYRFKDDGHYVYFTNCKGDVTSIEDDSISTRITNRINIY